MTHARSLCLLIILLGASLSLAQPAFAQDYPKGEISGGYQTLHLASSVDETLDKGWYADVTGNLSRYFGIVFEAGGSYKTIEQTETFGGATSNFKADVSLYQYMAGVRVSARPNATVTPFAHFLGGAIRTSADVSGSVSGGGQTFFASNTGDSTTDAALQAGGGINVMFTKTFGVRAGADYLAVFSEGDHTNVFRFAAGAVVAF